MQKVIEIEQYLLFFIDFIRVPKYRVRPIDITVWVFLNSRDLGINKAADELNEHRKRENSELFMKRYIQPWAKVMSYLFKLSYYDSMIVWYIHVIYGFKEEFVWFPNMQNLLMWHCNQLDLYLKKLMQIGGEKVA